VEIRWKCDPSLIGDGGATPSEEVLKFPGGLADYLEQEIGKAQTVTNRAFAGKHENKDTTRGAVEWAITWAPARDGTTRSYCNTIPTPAGGTHEQGLRNGLTKSLRAHGERVNNRKTGVITADDVPAFQVPLLLRAGSCAMRKTPEARARRAARDRAFMAWRECSASSRGCGPQRSPLRLRVLLNPS
jgi:topoisomerase-4 subunit B